MHDPSGTLGTPYGSIDNIAPTGPLSTSAVPPPWRRKVVFSLESGTPTDGVWVAHTTVTAADGGTWALTDLIYTGSSPAPAFAPAMPRVVVNGSDWPVIDVRRPLGVPGGYGSSAVLRGSVRTARTHRPIAGMRLSIWLEGSLEPFPDNNLQTTGTAANPMVHVRTDAAGEFSSALRLDAGINLWVLRQSSTAAVLQQRYFLVRWTRPTIAAHLAARVRAGRVVPVTGTVTRPVRSGESPVQGVVVQRKAGNRWLTVGASNVSRGRFSARIRVPRGSWSVRVVSVHTAGWATTYGRPLRVTAV